MAANDDFRPDLEGLRAVAVVLVLLFHANVPGLAGGFIGVDVFFVLSGFLITRLLLRELGRTGTVSLRSFYARRARRLLPAAALVLLVTVGVSAVLLPPLRVPDVGADASAAALYVANIHFALQATDYLQSELAPSPLLHYWSLGVEEQFYLCWPALVLLVGRGAGFARRIGLTAVAVSLLSFAGSVWLTVESAPWAFFSLPTRAWELGIGAILAAAGARLAAVPERLAALLGWLGLGLILVSSAAIDHRTPFPGTAAVLPALGSALVIAGGARASRLGPGRLLAAPAPRFVGRISYSLYLWHWPILVLPAGAGLPLPFWLRALLLLAAVALAGATQRWVEDPLRRGRFVGVHPARNLAAAAFLSLAVAASAAIVGRAAIQSLAGANAAHAANPAGASESQAELDAILDGAQHRSPDRSAPPETLDRPVPPGLRPSLVEARDAVPRPYADGCHLEEQGERSPACVYGDPGAKATVVLFGDCHALNWWDAALHLARERGWRLISLTKAACAPADVRPWYATLKRAYTECTAWRESSLARIAAERPALVILASSRFRDLVSTDGAHLAGPDELAAWAPGFIRTIRRIQQVPGVRVVLMGDTPISRFDVPVCLSANQDSVLACATPHVEAVDTDWREALAGAARASGATFIDPEPWVCPSRPCPAVIGDFLVFRDRHHLSPPFSVALARRLAQALPPLAEP
jgi:peptidoglycan/LPS O-acetylase OafA/YrhL